MCMLLIQQIFSSLTYGNIHKQHIKERRREREREEE